jgi:Kef-type K+ transport system membrane component KefB
VVAFALLTPFFFLRSGMNVSLPLVWANLGLLGVLLAVKLAAKSAAVYPLARIYAKPHAAFTTLLMSTGLTFGTISATYGYTAHIITRAQFSVLVCLVVLTAVVPTAVPGSPQGLSGSGGQLSPVQVVAEIGQDVSGQLELHGVGLGESLCGSREHRRHGSRQGSH